MAALDANAIVNPVWSPPVKFEAQFRRQIPQNKFTGWSHARVHPQVKPFDGSWPRLHIRFGNIEPNISHASRMHSALTICAAASSGAAVQTKPKEKIKPPRLDTGGTGFPPHDSGGGGGGGGGGGSSGGFILFGILLLLDSLKDKIKEEEYREHKMTRVNQYL